MSCALTTITQKPGDTFHYVGALTSAGAALDLTGWQINAVVRSTDLAGNPVEGDPLATPTVLVTAPATGGFTLRHNDTTTWPEDSLLVLDIALTAPDATVTTLRVNIKTGQK